MKALTGGYSKILSQQIRSGSSDELNKFSIHSVFLYDLHRARRIEPVSEYLFKDSINMQYYQTPSRPTEFTQHASIKTLPHDWYQDNRLHNETLKNYYHKRVQTNDIIQGAALSLFLLVPLGIKLLKDEFTKSNYNRDTYAEVLVDKLLPGKAMIANWYGSPVFIRRLSLDELRECDKIDNTKYAEEYGGYIRITEDKDTCIVVLKPQGSIDDYVCYSGKYKGWVNTKTGVEYTKLGQAMKGPKEAKNFECVDSELYDSILCIQSRMDIERQSENALLI